MERRQIWALRVGIKSTEIGGQIVSKGEGIKQRLRKPKG